ncbi:hypothetical protein F2Q70_00017173 [Brassica cretica]|uniref:Uncharacterized protein n=1 Tax=Brassica cretica TaxID=69181 RepID=A0A8S9I320_BRACR|nr:hypothetical protein F2Q70_00017173 [Brassica cretica]
MSDSTAAWNNSQQIHQGRLCTENLLIGVGIDEFIRLQCIYFNAVPSALQGNLKQNCSGRHGLDHCLLPTT